MEIIFSSPSLSLYLFHTRAFGSECTTFLSEEIHLIGSLCFSLYSLLLSTSIFSDCNGHLVLNQPPHAHPHHLSVFVSLFSSSLSVSPTLLAVYYRTDTTPGLFGSSSIAWRAKLSACYWHFNGNLGGDGGWNGETVTHSCTILLLIGLMVLLTHMLLISWFTM